MTEKSTPDLNQYPKAKAEFEEYYAKKYHAVSVSRALNDCDAFSSKREIFTYYTKDFFEIPFAYQQGVYLASLREKGVEIWVGPNACKEGYYSCLMTDDEWESPCETDTYHTALIFAIEAGFAQLEKAA